MQTIQSAFIFLCLVAFVGCQSTHTVTTDTAAPSPLSDKTWTTLPTSDLVDTVNIEASAEPVASPILSEPEPAPAVEAVSVFEVVETPAVPSARVVPSLPKGALDTLNKADELLDLSDEQYNALVAILEARTAEWKALMADKKNMDTVSFEAGKKRIFGSYAKQMLAIFTDAQSATWRKR